nr:putative ribonuclease H-like domain-containing protein [Tanacetum cinerariifolium]
TSSTNISGIKDVASQAVKKDVSFLRYIALLNWFHEAHMETFNDTIRNSDAHDDSQYEQDCNAAVPESSGISNPTATSKVPSTDQVEPAISLTVESKILTISSHVPTVCLDISPEFQVVEAMQEELLQFKIHNVWVLVDCPKGVRPIGTKWVLKNKKDERGIVIRNKARLVAQGYTHEEGIDYEEVFAPVARIEAIRLFLACALFMGFIVYQMDVKSAFLYGAIDEEVYVMQPSRFQDPEFPERVYKVEKAMYVLHQATRAWYGTLSKYLLDNGFQRGTIDQTLFIRKHKGEFFLVQVYVDDIIFGSSNPQLCREFEALMHDKFQMSAVGELTFFLGLQVLQKKDGIFLLQDKYVGDILKKFGYSDVRSMIGSLMYLTASKPDIMFAICACARHQVTPKECHIHTVKRIFRYLKGHPKLGLWYPKEYPFELVAYSDSDYGGATQDRKLTTRGCQFLGRRLISWQCKKQTIVATSTTEVEYVTAASGCGQVLWIQNQMLDYGLSKSCDDLYEEITSFVLMLIETTNQETKIIATVDGKPQTISESSLRRHLKLNDEEWISSLPDTELFENLSLMGYNILPSQRTVPLFASMIVTQGEGLANPTEPHHTPSPQEHHSPQHESPPLSHQTIIPEPIPYDLQTPTETLTPRRLTKRAIRIAQSKALSPAADELASFSRDDRHEEAFPTVSSLDAGQDRENIAKTSTIPHESSPRVSSLDADEGNKIKDQDTKISKLKARVKSLEDKERRREEHIQEDAPITGEIIDIEEELGADKSTKKGSNDTEEMKQWEDFVPMSLKEESERVKRSGIKLHQGSSKRVKISHTSKSKPSQEQQFKGFKGVSEEELKGMMQLVSLEEVYIEALQVKHPIIDWEIHTEGKREY